MLPEQKILGLPIKFIQEFFAIDTLFINIEKFKNHQKNFFDDFPEKNKNNHYCMHTSVYMFLSYFLAIEETINPIQLESIKYGFISLLMLVSYGIGVETYYNLKEIIDGFNLSKLGLLEKSYLVLNTAISSVSPDNFNYATVEIDSKDLIFAALERFIDDHGKKWYFY